MPKIQKQNQSRAPTAERLRQVEAFTRKLERTRSKRWGKIFAHYSHKIESEVQAIVSDREQESARGKAQLAQSQSQSILETASVVGYSKLGGAEEGAETGPSDIRVGIAHHSTSNGTTRNSTAESWVKTYTAGLNRKAES